MKEEAGSGDWQRPALPCCRRNEPPLLQLFLMRSSISVNRLRKTSTVFLCCMRTVMFDISSFSVFLGILCLISRSDIVAEEMQGRTAAFPDNQLTCQLFCSRINSAALQPIFERGSHSEPMLSSFRYSWFSPNVIRESSSGILHFRCCSLPQISLISGTQQNNAVTSGCSEKT